MVTLFHVKLPEIANSTEFELQIHFLLNIHSLSIARCECSDGKSAVYAEEEWQMNW